MSSMRIRNMFLLITALAVTFLLACGGGTEIKPTSEVLIKEVVITSTPEPTSTSEPTSISQPTSTPQPTATPDIEATIEPKVAKLVTSIPTVTPIPTLAPALTSPHISSKEPADVGTSHFGALGNELEGFSGAWIRPHPGPFVWGWIEPSVGGYNWTTTDKWVREWQQKQLAVLVTIWPFADWDQNACHTDRPKAVNIPNFLSRKKGVGQRLYYPCDEDAYLSWLSGAVERYDGDGKDDMPGLQYPVRYWEMLNEPEMQGPELTFFQENSATYLKLLKLSYSTIKATDPSAVVLLGGQAGMQPRFVAYWEPVLRGARGFFDVANIHSIGRDDEFFAPDYRIFLNSLGYADKPYWITEAGIRSSPSESLITEDNLAKMVFISFGSAFGEGADVIIKIHKGIAVGTDAYDTYLLMARTVGDFTTATRLAESVVRFEMPDGSTVYLLWDNARLPSEVTGEVKVVTYKGVESQSETSMVTGQVPILVIVAPSNSKKR